MCELKLRAKPVSAVFMEEGLQIRGEERGETLRMQVQLGPLRAEEAYLTKPASEKVLTLCFYDHPQPLFFPPLLLLLPLLLHLPILDFKGHLCKNWWSFHVLAQSFLEFRRKKMTHGLLFVRHSGLVHRFGSHKKQKQKKSTQLSTMRKKTV